MKSRKMLYILLAFSSLIISCGKHHTTVSNGNDMGHGLAQITTGNIYGRWQLEKYHPAEFSSILLVTVKSDKHYRLQLLDTGTFSCATDCNSISGNFVADDSLLIFQDLAWTELACDEMTIENELKVLLPTVKKYTATSDSLFFHNNEGRTLAVFSKM